MGNLHQSKSVNLKWPKNKIIFRAAEREGQEGQIVSEPPGLRAFIIEDSENFDCRLQEML